MGTAGGPQWALLPPLTASALPNPAADKLNRQKEWDQSVWNEFIFFLSHGDYKSPQVPAWRAACPRCRPLCCAVHGLLLGRPADDDHLFCRLPIQTHQHPLASSALLSSTPQVSVRTMDYFKFMNTKVLFKQVRAARVWYPRPYALVQLRRWRGPLHLLPGGRPTTALLLTCLPASHPTAPPPQVRNMPKAQQPKPVMVHAK